MRRAKFEILLNSYLDGEISREQLSELCRELSRNPERRRIFDCYRRLNQATCKAHFDADCLSAMHGHAQPRRAFSMGLWGGAAGAFAGMAIFLFATSALRHRAADAQPLEGLTARVEAPTTGYMALRDRPAFQFSSDGFRTVSTTAASQPEPLTLLMEPRVGLPEFPQIFPGAQARTRPHHMVRVFDDYADAPSASGGMNAVPVVFHGGQ